MFITDFQVHILLLFMSSRFNFSLISEFLLISMETQGKYINNKKLAK
jgi:hypothetical protein